LGVVFPAATTCPRLRLLRYLPEYQPGANRFCFVITLTYNGLNLGTTGVNLFVGTTRPSSLESKLRRDEHAADLYLTDAALRCAKHWFQSNAGRRILWQRIMVTRWFKIHSWSEASFVSGFEDARTSRPRSQRPIDFDRIEVIEQEDAWTPLS
jgi:hypothetical protein